MNIPEPKGVKREHKLHDSDNDYIMKLDRLRIVSPLDLAN